MLLSASIISRRANWELGIGVTSWHQQSRICQQGTGLVLLQSQPCKVQGRAQDPWIVHKSADNTWRKSFRPKEGCVAENLQTTVSQVLALSRKLQLHISVHHHSDNIRPHFYFIGMTWENNQHQIKHRSPKRCHSTKELPCPHGCFTKIKHSVRCDACNLCLFITDRLVERENLFLW